MGTTNAYYWFWLGFGAALVGDRVSMRMGRPMYEGNAGIAIVVVSMIGLGVSLWIRKRRGGK